MTDASLQRTGMMPDHILANCWTETVDPAFYKLSENGKFNWGKALIGDRMYTLIQIRIAGKGHSMYDFKHQCENPQCKKQFEWEIDLNDLPVQMLSDKVRAQFAEGNFNLQCVVPGTEETRLLTESAAGLALVKPRREIVTGTGKKATFRLQTGDDEAALIKAQLSKKKKKRSEDEEENAIVDMLITRTKAIEDVTDLVQFFEKMSLDEIARMVDRYEEQDCGVDIAIEIECPECERLQEKNLPFGADFFFQRKKAPR